jgi:hypothetical protein
VVTNQQYQISWGYVGSGGGEVTGLFENNNSPSCGDPNVGSATPLPSELRLNTYADNKYDFFSIDITTTGQIQVFLIGHPVGGSQVQVRNPLLPNSNSCDPINSTTINSPFGIVPSGGGDVYIQVGVSTPGRYYLRVNLPGDSGPGTLYRVWWRFLPLGFSPIAPDSSTRVFTTNPFNPSAGDIPGNVVEGGLFTFYWSGLQSLGGFDQILMRIRDDIELSGCPKNTFPSDASQTDPSGFARNYGNTGSVALKGAFTFRFRKHGSYAVGIRVMRGGTVLWEDEKPIRVSCGFTSAAVAGATISPAALTTGATANAVEAGGVAIPGGYWGTHTMSEVLNIPPDP